MTILEQVQAGMINNAIHYTLKYIGPKLFNFFSPTSISALDASLTRIATVSSILIPNGKIHDDIERFLEIEKNGGIKNLTEKEVLRCSTKLNIDTLEAKKIGHCLEVSFEDKTNPKDALTSFITCHPMTAIQALKVITNSINFAKCVAEDVLNIAKEIDLDEVLTSVEQTIAVAGQDANEL